ncbi:MAG: uroporphyrinogen-III C-methyltransferase [Tannerella sp.]|jgi:uroporphyrinogen III methyltransferase/synthase|nr:uroporphyrinogen-III C-methyltransferase [Tannerella sp.]
METLKVTSRESALSLIQVKEVFSFFPAVSYRLFPVQSYGDKNMQVSLMDAVAPDFFTRELDNALIRGEADVAIHSAKDLPYPLPPELELYALLEAFDKTDSLVSRNNLTLAQLPPGAKVGTSSAARKAELLSHRPDLEIVSIRGTIEKRISQVDSGFVDALIVATCALKRLGLTDRIAGTLPFKTHPLQGNLAVTGKRGRPEIKNIFAPQDIRRNYGKVILVGFGPGNPDLLTLGGDRALAKADVIFHDDLLDPSFLSRYPGEKVYVGKRKDIHRYHQDEINELLYQAAISGKNTVRLKGGDPMIFAHGREEIDYLQSRFTEVEVIPGISSGIALSAYTRVPLTHRGLASSVAFVTGHSRENVSVPDADTLVYYMGGNNLSDIAKKLIASGRPETTPVALVYNVSLPDQKLWFSSLAELQHSVVKYPTPVLMVAGEVVAFENGGANRETVLITGTSRKNCTAYPNAVHVPLIKIDKITDNKPLNDSIRKMVAFDWIIFTSRYGVRYFFEALEALKTDIRCFAHIRFASVGKTTTAELNKHRIYPDFEPETESAESIVRFFREQRLTGKRLLLPRSDRGLKYLSEELEKAGNHVTDIPVYRNTVNETAETMELSQFRKIIFSSPSGVEAFIRIYGEIPSGIQLIAKGETTEKKLKASL